MIKINLYSNRFVDENEKIKVQKFFELLLSLRTKQQSTEDKIKLNILSESNVVWNIFFNKVNNVWRLLGSNNIEVTINPTISEAIDLLKLISLEDIEQSIKKWNEKYGINI